MSNLTLREMAKSYAKGTLGKEAYRKSRSDLIKNIIDGTVVIKAINYEGPIRPSNDIEDAITEGIDRDKTEITAPKQTTTPKHKSTTSAPIKKRDTNNKNNSTYIFILISVIIVVLLILAVVLFYPKPPESTLIESTGNSSISNNSTIEDGTESTSNNSAAAEELIGIFLNEKNWNKANLDSFITSWSALTQEERNSAMDTKRMQRLKASVYKQFSAGEALASIDSEKARMKQQEIIDFAKAVGIEDSRLVLD
jgi:hypothetical protein